MGLNERCSIVDENDNVIGEKVRSTFTKSDRARMAVVVLENSKGEILIHKRAESKSSYPGFWENAAGGGVKAGQSYEQAAYDELAEEIGVSDVELEFITKTKVITKNGEKFCGWFRGFTDMKLDEFTLAPDEVAEVKWVNKAELLTAQKEDPEKFMPSAAQWLEIFNL